MVKEISCIACGSEKPLFRRKYCNRCARQIQLKQSRDKKREFRQALKNYDKGDRLEYKKAWRDRRERQDWNEYMREYRRKHPEKIREQNRVASKKYRNRARQ